MKDHIKIIIKGRVQGVGYRYFIQQKAIEFNIKGFVENKKDKTVYVEAEGTSSLLDQFLEWCYIGSPLSKVSNISISSGVLRPYTNFEIFKS